MPEPSLEELAVFLPQYLTSIEKDALFSELKKIPADFIFYDSTNQFANDFLQGDGWKGFTAINFHTRESRNVSGVIISNSCDIDPANEEDHPRNVLFAPIIELADYQSLLIANNSPDIERKLALIRSQRITDIFYLPANGQSGESMILLDDIHLHPLDHFVLQAKSKLFTMTMTAFYVFVIKLSIHFHRVKENVRRFLPLSKA